MDIKNIKEESLLYHKKLGGKIEILAKAKIKSAKDLRLAYTPGVGAVSSYVAQHPKEAGIYTIKNNTVAVISDGSAVLGLGNIGPYGALPVMEGKAMIFKEFAGINAFPIVLATQDTKEIISTIKNIAPVFGAINLEDISAPRCFEIEETLQKELDIFVMHDDQHATAIITLAGLINAFRVAGKNFETARIVVAGPGAAGTAIVKLLVRYGAKNILVVGRGGILSPDDKKLPPHQQHLAKLTNEKNKTGTLEDAFIGADAAIGVSVGGNFKPVYIQKMNERPIVFALANPTPEIFPDEAKKAGAFIVATGRSDFPNQINNALVFPGLFRGVLKNGVKKLTPEIEIAAARALSSLVKKPTHDNIIPSIFDKKVVLTIAAKIR